MEPSSPSSRPAPCRALDPDSQRWVERLGAPPDDEAVAELHALLLRVAFAEAARRAGTHGLTGPELEDLAHQAADDAVVSILRSLDGFRGDSRFTTWAYKFAVFELSGKVGRHVWRRDGVAFDAEQWERFPERLGAGPSEVAESRALADAVRRAVEEDLTPHQRRVFVAIVLNGTPLDALAAELGCRRNAIYKTIFDARRKIRAHLVTNGYLPDPAGTSTDEREVGR